MFYSVRVYTAFLGQKGFALDSSCRPQACISRILFRIVRLFLSADTPDGSLKLGCLNERFTSICRNYQYFHPRHL